MKSLSEIKTYTPILFLFIFVAAVFASCFFDNRQEKRAQRDDKRYYQFMQISAVIHNDYVRKTGCHISSPLPGQTIIPASNPDGFRCIVNPFQYSDYAFIVYFETGKSIPSNTSNVSIGTKLICKCQNNQSPLTGENTWYKRNPSYPDRLNYLFSTTDRAEPFFTHTYQKDSNGNIIGVDPFVPTNPGDVFLCLPTCEKDFKIYEKITIQ